MKFAEAIQAMEEGKETRTTDPEEPLRYKIHQRILQVYMPVSGWRTSLTAASELLKYDWEVVNDDKEWNLAKQYYDNPNLIEKSDELHCEYLFKKDEVVKCRDLIIKDMVRFLPAGALPREDAKNIVKKRFGDL